MPETNTGKSIRKRRLPESFRYFLPSEETATARRNLTPPTTQAEERLAFEWSPSPPQGLLQRATKEYQEPRLTLKDSVDNDTPRLFQSEHICTELTTQIQSFTVEQEQSVYISKHPLIQGIRNLVCARNIGCALCAFYEWGPIVDTHKLKRCSHRDEAGEARPWLEMFRRYQARGGGSGARCAHCRFPITLCLRTVYREKMDLQYGSEVEAREDENVLYDEVQCS